MQTFADGGHRGAHEDFRRWQERNPSGYVLNLSSSGSATMHRSLCSHVAGLSDGSYSLTRKPKMCSNDIGELEEWIGEGGREFERCRSCM